jgi:hypothetical protein
LGYDTPEEQEATEEHEAVEERERSAFKEVDEEGAYRGGD